VVFTFVNGILLRPLPYRAPDRLVKLWEQSLDQGFDQLAVTPANYNEWTRTAKSFEALACYQGWEGGGTYLLLTPDGPQRIEGTIVSASLFPLLGVRPLLGRTFTPREDDGLVQAVVLSYGLWQRLFALDPNAVGRTLTLDSYSRRQYTIAGVMPPGFRFPGNAELWLPLAASDFPRTSRTGHWLQVIGRLRPGVTVASARAEMARAGSRIKIVPLLHEITGESRPALWILLAAVSLLLLIACGNVANLLLAQAARRRGEMAIRIALGASNGRLLRQLLGESLVIALGGGVAGGMAAVLLTRWGAAALGAHYPLPRLEEMQTADPRVLAFTMVVSLATALIFGLAPALLTIRSGLGEGLKAGGRTPAGLPAHRLRSALVVSEIALTTLLVAGSLLAIRSLAHLANVDPGFRPAGVLAGDVDLSSSRYSSSARPGPNRPQVFVQRLIERLQALPEVEAVGATAQLPLSASGESPRMNLASGAATIRIVSPDYFRAMGTPLVAGRAFTDADTDGAPLVAIVNQTLARRLSQGRNPLGERIATQARERTDQFDNSREIVGVVADVRHVSLEADPRAEVYVPYFQFSMRYASVVVRARAGVSRSLADALAREVRALNSYTPLFGIRALEQVVDDGMALQRLRSALLGIFAALAVALAAIGVYGVISYVVTQRSREIAVRVALGAQQRSIRRLVFAQGLRWTAAGVVIGLAGTLALGRLLRTVLYGIGPDDPTTLASTALLLAAIALAACWIPARRAARLDPMIVLRSE
jgi:putative ABC transport system permease protein